MTFEYGQLVRVRAATSCYCGAVGTVARGPVSRDGRDHYWVDLGGFRRLLFGAGELEAAS